MQPPTKLIAEGQPQLGVALSKNEYNYMRASTGKTSYVTYPNKSMKIIANSKKQRSKILNKLDPLELNDKPVGGLSGPILNQMV